MATGGNTNLKWPLNGNKSLALKLSNKTNSSSEVKVLNHHRVSWRTSDILLLAYSIRIAPRSEESRKEPWSVDMAWAAQRKSWYSTKATGDPPLECIRSRENPGKLCKQQWRCAMLVGKVVREVHCALGGVTVLNKTGLSVCVLFLAGI